MPGKNKETRPSELESSKSEGEKDEKNDLNQISLKGPNER